MNTSIHNIIIAYIIFQTRQMVCQVCRVSSHQVSWGGLRPDRERTESFVRDGAFEVVVTQHQITHGERLDLRKFLGIKLIVLVPESIGGTSTTQFLGQDVLHGSADR